MAELRLEGATVVLDDVALTQLAGEVAQLLARNGSSEIEPWIRGAMAAAEYLGCKPKRVYDLVSQDLLEHRKDGSVLTFRREWLDAALHRGHGV